MKIFVFILLIINFLIFFSCKKDSDNNVEKSSEAFILTFSVPNQISSNIDIINNKINIIMPASSSLDSIIATFTLSNAALAKIGKVVQVSGKTANNFSSPLTYVVIAEDGSTNTSWVVSVNNLKSTTNKKY